jgi:DNA-binding Xre family transcriptional regulator
MSDREETTFDKFMKDEEQKQKFNEEYNQFLLSEFLLDAMEKEHLSVRKLSEKSGVSTSIIQNIKKEKATNVTMKTVLALTSSLGYRINFEKMNYSQN